jgi:hypothetical protein
VQMLERENVADGRMECRGVRDGLAAFRSRRRIRGCT